MQIDVDYVVESLARTLARLAAAKAETAMLSELNAIQHDLLEQARDHRESHTELGGQLAGRLEAISERLGRVWDELDESHVSRQAIRNRRPSTTSSAGPTTDGEDMKRSRGRPRKPASHSPAAIDQRDATSSQADT